MNVLSLFDGMSCGRIALERAGLPVTNYFASEVDKYAMEVSKRNYPDIEQLGDVTNNCFWDLPQIDLLIGGSPCQGFSFAGKQLDFDDPRSKLFFTFIDCIEAFKPKYFLLENVGMKKQSEDVITNILGVEPIEINSNLVSAQNRKRLYWTNIPNVSKPEDRGIILKDIMLENTNEYVKVSKKGRYKKFQNKASCLTGGGNSGGNHSDMDILGIARNRCFQIGEALGVNGHDLLKRVYADYGKAPTVTCITGGNQFSKIAIDDYIWRRLTPNECERLQTVPDDYTEGVSNSQRYKMLGNGWTVDVIAHIFKQLKESNK